MTGVALQAAPVKFRIEVLESPDPEAGIRWVLGSSGTINNRTITLINAQYEGSGEHTIATKLRALRGVVSVTPIEPKNPMDARRSNSAKEIQASIAGYRDAYKAYYRAQHGNNAKPEKVPGAGFIEAYEHFYSERAYPGDTIDWGKYAFAETARDLMPAADIYGAPGQENPAFLGSWQFVGPKNLTIPYQTYYGTPPLGGRLNGVAWHPTNANILYIAGAQSGVWKTTDGGTTWSCLSDTWTNLRTSCITIDPVNPNTVYVGTGDWDGGLGSGYGIRKTTDGGATWTTIGGAEFTGAAVKDIIVDPENPQLITVASSYGATTKTLYRSTNGGTTWSAIAGPGSLRWAGLSFGAQAAGVRPYYAAAENGGGIYRSLDRGLNWTMLTLPVGVTYIDIAASPVNTNNVYFVEGGTRTLYRSTDRGTTWTNISAGFPNGNASLGTNYNWSQVSYDLHMHCSSNGATDVLYVGLIDLVQSVNGGSTWQSVGRSYTGTALLHNDQHSFCVNPQNPNQALVGADGGLFRFNWVPASNTWSFTPLNANLGGTTQFYHVAYHPTDPNRMLGGTQDNAAPAALGDLNNWANPGAGDGCWQGISQQNPNVQYTTWQYLGMEKTTNNWSSSTGISPTTTGESVPFVGVIEVDPNDGNLCYAGTNYLHRYSNTTSSWTYRLGTQQFGSGTGNIRAIAIAKSDSNRLYVGTSNGEVWMSTNKGTSWTNISSGGIGIPARVVKDISVHPTNPSDILVTVSGTGSAHVLRCADTAAASRTWADVDGSGATGSPDTSHNTVTRDPSSPTSRWYVGTDVGVFFTNDAGATWSNATAPLGLPNVRVDDLTAIAATNFLYAGTHGRGIWKIDLTNVSVSSMTITPNPVYAVNGTTLTVQLSSPAPTGGLNVALNSGNAALYGLPTFVTVPAGSTTTSLSVTTGYTAADVTVNVTATLNGTVNVPLLIKFLLGDIDHDGEVGPGDFGLLSVAFGSLPGDSNWNAACDLDGDFEIGPGDFGILSAQFGLP